MPSIKLIGLQDSYSCKQKLQELRNTRQTTSTQCLAVSSSHEKRQHTHYMQRQRFTQTPVSTRAHDSGPVA